MNGYLELEESDNCRFCEDRGWIAYTRCDDGLTVESVTRSHTAQAGGRAMRS